MNLPPYLSRTPPPLNGIEDEENDDEEFGTFVVSSDLGEEGFDVFDKTSHTLRCEDNISEDSGFCMNSVGQTQSPCDISPLSSSYNNKGNDCVTVDNQGTTDLDSSIDEKTHPKVTEESEEINNESYEINIQSHSDEDVPGEMLPDKIEDSHVDASDNICLESDDDCVKHPFYLFDADSGSLNIGNTDVSSGLNVFPSISDPDEPLDRSVRNSTLHCSESEFSDVRNITDSGNVALENIPINNFSNLPKLENDLEIDEVHSELNIHSFNAPNSSDEEIRCKQFHSIVCKEEADANDWVSDDEFSDFTSFQSTSAVCTEAPHNELKLKDFDNHFSEEADFPLDVPEADDTCSFCSLQTAIETNVVWNCLQCFEETPAFKYQWSSSCTNMKFLQALQIDSRNILHGPWSKTSKLYWSDVPSSCENITFNSDFLDYSSSTAPKIVHSEFIPDPHFDWLSSGLVNPLQTVNCKDHTAELQIEDSCGMHTNKSKNILENLPSLSFVKVHHIVFKRD